MKNLSRRGLQLVVLHWLIGGAEEHGLARQLADTGAGAQRLIVDPDVGVKLVVSENHREEIGFGNVAPAPFICVPPLDPDAPDVAGLTGLSRPAGDERHGGENSESKPDTPHDCTLILCIAFISISTSAAGSGA